ncbi:MAG: hypothetical protein WCF57_04095 [Pyrinomonadaceae bacterium]
MSAQGQKIIKGLLLALLLCAPAAALAQGGGKAEPSRIEFKRGRKSATVTGRIRGDVQAEYVFAARQGQRVKISLTSIPVKSAILTLSSADGVDYKFKASAYGWTGVAPVTGDYLLFVTKSSEQPGTSNYSLTLKIE